jgi:prophage regulatory protein
MCEPTTKMQEPMFRLIRMRELCVMLSLSRSTIYDRLNPKSKRYDPAFPKPLKLGTSAVGWQLQDVMSWIKNLQSFNTTNIN